MNNRFHEVVYCLVNDINSVYLFFNLTATKIKNKSEKSCIFVRYNTNF